MRPFLATLLGLTFVVTPIMAEPDRAHYFDQAAAVFASNGDRNGAALLRELGAMEPVAPRELSREAIVYHGADAARYDRLRNDWLTARRATNRNARHDWRLNRAEAALHAASYELEQERMARASDLRRYLSDAAWILGGLTRNASLPRRQDPDIRLSVDRRRIVAGETVLVQWSVDRAEKVRLDDETVPNAGSRMLAPAQTSYYLIHAENGEAMSEEAIVIEVLAPRPIVKPSVSISVVPEVALESAAVVVRWRSAHADTVRLDGAIVEPNGMIAVTATNHRRFVIDAEGRGGRAGAAASLGVIRRPPPPPPPPPPPSAGTTPPNALSESAVVPVRPHEILVPPAPVWLVVRFEGSSNRADSSGQAALDEAARRLKSDSTLTASLEGFTNSRGSEAAIRRRSRESAEAVRNALVRRGVDGGRLQVRGRGVEAPILPERDEHGRINANARRMNRRVEIIIAR